MAVLLCIKSEKSRKRGGEWVGKEGRQALSKHSQEKRVNVSNPADEPLGKRMAVVVARGLVTWPYTDRPFARPEIVFVCSAFRSQQTSFPHPPIFLSLSPPPITFSPQQSEGAEGPQPFRISINRDIKKEKKKKIKKKIQHTPPFLFLPSRLPPSYLLESHYGCVVCAVAACSQSSGGKLA